MLLLLAVLSCDVDPLDVHRFPPRETVKRALAMISAHREWIEGRLLWELEPSRVRALNAAMEYSCWTRKAWNALGEAASSNGKGSTARLRKVIWLRELRDELGPEAWARGEMPEPLAVWLMEGE